MSHPNSFLPFLEILEWVEHDPNLLMWKVPDENKDIKNGAQLIVRESQSAMLMNEGKIADIFKAGIHKLSTGNIPVLTRLKGWKYGFESPFKADVYYFSVKQFVALKWGTPTPILMLDPQFGQVRVRAFGSYNIRITDEGKFFKEYAGTFPQLTVFELEHQLRDFIAPKFGEVIANAGIPVLAIAGSISALNDRIRPIIQPYFEEFGIEVTQFTVSSVTLPEEVTAYYDKVTGMNMVDDIDKFQRFNAAVALSKEGSLAQNGAQQGLAMGLLIDQMNQKQGSQQQLGTEVDSPMIKLQKLKTMFDSQLIDEDEYKAKKAEILGSM